MYGLLANALDQPLLGTQRTNLEVSRLCTSPRQHLLTYSGDDFDEVDFSVPQGDDPDGVTLNPVVASDHFRRRNSLPYKGYVAANRAIDQKSMQRPRSPLARNASSGQIPGPQTPMSNGFSNMAPPADTMAAPRIPAPMMKPQQPLALHQPDSLASKAQQLPPSHPPQAFQSANCAHSNDTSSLDSSNTSDHEPPVGFFTARAAESLQSGPTSVLKAPAFNPHLESPSIRKTAGVDHTKTKPVGRETVGAPPAPAPVAAAQRACFVNPQTDKARKVGMPGMASPLQNRGSYKPPQMKRPADSSGARSALGDVTSASVNMVSDATGDVKRQRIGADQSLNSNHGMLDV